jgi:hypothetical protein
VVGFRTNTLKLNNKIAAAAWNIFIRNHGLRTIILLLCFHAFTYLNMISTNHDRKYKSLLYTDSEIPKFKTRMTPTSTNPGSIIGLHLFPQIRIRRLAGKTPYKNMSIIVSCIVNDCNSSPCRLRSSAKILSDLRPNFILSNSRL